MVENLIVEVNHSNIFQKMVKSGADIVDVGGESTRPGSKTIEPTKEWEE